MFNHSLEIDSASSLREANISLILKKGKCPEYCASYRPIALLNTDQKLLSKILAMRLEKVLPCIVGEDQTGFVKGQNSSDNVRRLLNIIQLSWNSNDPALVLSLDAEKAFDQVKWLYLFYTLEKISVLTNGMRSSNFTVGIGKVTLSAHCLFDIMIEPLAIGNKADNKALISGISVGKRNTKLLSMQTMCLFFCLNHNLPFLT